MSEAPQPGWYPDPENPGGQRWWDGSAWGPAAPEVPPATSSAPETPTPSSKSSTGFGKGIDVVCWVATWVAAASLQFFFMLGLAWDASGISDEGGSSQVLPAIICGTYLAALLALYQYSQKRSYRLGQQLAVSVAAMVLPLFLFALSSSLGWWPQDSFEHPKPLAFAVLLLSLFCGGLSGWGVVRLKAGLAAGVLLAAVLTAGGCALVLLDVEKWFEDWADILENSGWLIALAFTVVLAAVALRLEPRYRNMATWIWPTVWQVSILTVLSLSEPFDDTGEKFGVMLAIVFVAIFAGLAMVLRRVGLLAFAAVGSVLVQAWLIEIFDLGLTGATLGLPASLLLLALGIWVWRHQERLRALLPGPVARLHSGGDEPTLW